MTDSTLWICILGVGLLAVLYVVVVTILERKNQFTNSDLPAELLDKMRGPKPPDDFKSNGCTCSPDSIGGVDLRPACHFHDYHYSLPKGHKDRDEDDNEAWRAKTDFRFFRNLRKCDLSRRRANTYFRFVRCFGFLFYNYQGEGPGSLGVVVRTVLRAVIRF